MTDSGWFDLEYSEPGDGVDDNFEADTCQNCETALTTDDDVVSGHCADCRHVAHEEDSQNQVALVGAHGEGGR